MLEFLKRTSSLSLSLGAILGVALILTRAETALSAFGAIESDASVLNEGATLSTSVGVSGVYKNGFQTKVEVKFSDQEAVTAIELETLDVDGAPFIARHELTEDDRRSGRCEFSFLFPKATGRLIVRKMSADGTLDESELTPGVTDGFNAPLSPSRPIYLVLGEPKQGFSDAFAELRLKEERRPEIVSIRDLSELPTDFRSYESVDRVFLSTSAPEIYEGFSSDSPALGALLRWVERGGRVVLLAGVKSLPLLRPGGALSELLPGESLDERLHEFRSVNSLTTDLQNVKNLVMTGSRSNPFLRAPVLRALKPGALVEMQEAETPLLVSRACGLGTIVYFAADLSEAPIANWTGRGRLLLKILGIDPDATSGAESGAPLVNQSYADISGQARSALDSFSGARVISFAVIGAILLVYLIAIAPWDWFLAKKLLRRPIITWVSFPLCVVIFSAIAVWISSASTPKEPSLNQADALDVDLTSGMARITTWLGFYSPVGERYDIHYFPSSALSSADQSDGAASLVPLASSGSSLGGAEQSNFVAREWKDAYELHDGELKKLPIATRSSKSFIGRWTGRLSGLPSAPRLWDDGLSLHGAVVNPFDVPIYSAYIVYRDGAYALGTLPPGETQIERGGARLSPKRVLNDHKSSVPSSSLGGWTSSSYNASSKRIPYILTAASFYELGGGVNNYGLEKRLQRDMDLSDLVRSGRAIIFGTIVDPDYADYSSSAEDAHQAVDARQLDSYRRRMAERRGEEYQTAREKTLERYGASGTSPDFFAADVRFRESGDDGEARGASDRRYVVVRLIAPIELNALE